MTIALALATAVVCAPVSCSLTPTAMQQAAWRIPSHCILVAPKPAAPEIKRAQHVSGRFKLPKLHR